MRPDHGHLAGVPLAAIMPANFYKALLPDDLDAIVAYLRTVKPVRNEVADPVYKAPVRRDPYPDAEAGFSKAMFTDPVRRGAYLVTIGHCMECHSAWSRGVSDFKTGLGRGGRFSRCAKAGRREQPASPPTSPRIRTAGIGAWSDAEIVRAITHGVARDGRALKPPMAYGYYAGAEASRSGRHHRLSAHGAAAAMMPSQNSRFHAARARKVRRFWYGLGSASDVGGAGPRMIDTVAKPKTRVKTKTERPRLHKVILVNDDFTPREFVVTVLKAEFRMTEDQAHKVMITAHRRGVCVVAVFTKDVAETKATRATDAGRAKGYPLLFTTEPEE